jgi:hypothetical protein
MSIKNILYTNHAVKQMFQRNISTNEVEEVLESGEVIMEYIDDKPFPSKLLFSIINLRPLHIVCSFNEKENTSIIITVYEPSLDVWENDFKTRKK